MSENWKNDNPRPGTSKMDTEESSDETAKEAETEPESTSSSNEERDPMKIRQRRQQALLEASNYFFEIEPNEDGTPNERRTQMTYRRTDGTDVEFEVVETSEGKTYTEVVDEEDEIYPKAPDEEESDEEELDPTDKLIQDAILKEYQNFDLVKQLLMEARAASEKIFLQAEGTPIVTRQQKYEEELERLPNATNLTKKQIKEILKYKTQNDANPVPFELLSTFADNDELFPVMKNLVFKPEYYIGSKRQQLSLLARYGYHNLCVEKLVTMLEIINPEGFVVNLEECTAQKKATVFSWIINKFPNEKVIKEMNPDIILVETDENGTNFISHREHRFMPVSSFNGKPRVIKIEVTTGSDKLCKEKLEKYKKISNGGDLVVIQCAMEGARIWGDAPKYLRSLMMQEIVQENLRLCYLVYSSHILDKDLVNVPEVESDVHPLLLECVGQAIINLESVLSGKVVKEEDFFKPGKPSFEEVKSSVNKLKSRLGCYLDQDGEPNALGAKSMMHELNKFHEFVKDDRNKLKCRGKSFPPYVLENPYTDELEVEANISYQENFPGLEMGEGDHSLIGATMFGEDINERVIIFSYDCVKGPQIKKNIIRKFLNTTGCTSSQHPLITEICKMNNEEGLSVKIKKEQYKELYFLFGVGRKTAEKEKSCATVVMGNPRKPRLPQMSEGSYDIEGYLCSKENDPVVLPPKVDRDYICNDVKDTLDTINWNMMDAVSEKCESLESVKARCLGRWAQDHMSTTKSTSMIFHILPMFSIEWRQTSETRFRANEGESIVFDEDLGIYKEKVIVVSGIVISRPLPGNSQNNKVDMIAVTLIDKKIANREGVSRYRKEGNCLLRYVTTNFPYIINVQKFSKQPYQIASLTKHFSGKAYISFIFWRFYEDYMEGTEIKPEKVPGVSFYSMLIKKMCAALKKPFLLRTTEFWCHGQNCNAGYKQEGLNRLRYVGQGLFDNREAHTSNDNCFVGDEFFEAIYDFYTSDTHIREVKAILSNLERRGYCKLKEPEEGGSVDKMLTARLGNPDFKKLATSEAYIHWFEALGIDDLERRAEDFMRLMDGKRY